MTSSICLYAWLAFTPSTEAYSDHWILSEVGRRLDPPIHILSMEELISASLSVSARICLAGLHRMRCVRVSRSPVCFEGLRIFHPDSCYRFPGRCIPFCPRLSDTPCGCSVLIGFAPGPETVSYLFGDRFNLEKVEWTLISCTCLVLGISLGVENLNKIKMGYRNSITHSFDCGSGERI